MEEEGSWVFVVIVRGLFSGEAEVKTWAGQGWASSQAGRKAGVSHFTRPTPVELHILVFLTAMH
jgi:hypothetical protein